MVSNINDALPVYRSFALSAPMRTNFGHAKSEITTLQAQVASLQSDVRSLQTSVNSLRSDVNALQTEVSRIGNEIQRTVAHYATNAPPSPVNGQMWFHPTTGVLSVWHAGQWRSIN